MYLGLKKHMFEAGLRARFRVAMACLKHSKVAGLGQSDGQRFTRSIDRAIIVEQAQVVRALHGHFGTRGTQSPEGDALRHKLTLPPSRSWLNQAKLFTTGRPSLVLTPIAILGIQVSQRDGLILPEFTVIYRITLVSL